MAKADSSCCVPAFRCVPLRTGCRQTRTRRNCILSKSKPSKDTLKGAGGLFATAASVMCSPSVPPERQAALKPVLPMSEVPAVAYHRTNRSNWKSIAKNGLIPGGGDTVNSGRAHIYMSEYKYGDEGYRSGLRGKCPIEIKIAVGQAVKGGIIDQDWRVSSWQKEFPAPTW